MPYIVVQNFKDGLDTRKSILTAPPGSLQKCSNAHLTRGGEIEKRKAFAAKYALPAGNTFGLKGARGRLYTFGSLANPGTIPPGVNYQQLAAASGSPMTRVLQAENYGGYPYVIAQYLDGTIGHFYNGARVTDLEVVAQGIQSLTTIASRLAYLVDGDIAYIASAAGAVFTITAAVPGVPFAISAATATAGPAADQSITLTTIQANVAAVTAAAASGSFDITGGTAGALNLLSSVKVNGVEILGTNVLWGTDNTTTAAIVAAQINSFASGYAATSSGQTVTIAAPATGTAANGYAILTALSGTMLTGNLRNLSGGVNAVAALAQIVTATIAGTLQSADQYALTIDGKLFNTTTLASGMPTSVRTFGGKLYATCLSLLEFSMLNNCLLWQITNTGAGNINMSNQDAGSEVLTAIGVFQSELAIFSRTNLQVWSVDTDPANNKAAQSIPNIGTGSPNSLTSFGDSDLFFLSDTGIRSLKIRIYTSFGAVSDIGTAIDTLVLEAMRTSADSIVQRAAGVIEPRDGRYMLALGPTVFVFSYFSGSQISAWSTYDPGFSISDWAVLGTRLYARAADTIYAYGGDDLNTYDSCLVDVILPYLDDGKPATIKSSTGVDAAAVGVWTLYAGTDPQQPDERDKIGTITQGTYGLTAFPTAGQGTHFGLRFTSQAAGYAKLSNVAIHMTEDETD